MSVCNVSVGQDEILVLTDTLTYDRDRKPAGLTDRKAFISDNGRFAWTIRGSHERATRYDDILRGLSSFDMARRVLTAHLENPDLQPGYWGLEWNIFGYSDDDFSLSALRLTLPADGSGRSVQEMTPGIHLAPAPKNISIAMPETADDAMMVRMALVQYKIQEKHKFPMCVGGLMHLTRITAKGCHQWIVGSYPDYMTHLSDIGNTEEKRIA